MSNEMASFVRAGALADVGWFGSSHLVGVITAVVIVLVLSCVVCFCTCKSAAGDVGSSTCSMTDLSVCDQTRATSASSWRRCAGRRWPARRCS